MKESSMKNCSSKTEKCLICSAPTSTLHYQIIICYACAAFYRRSIKIHHSYVCQKLDGKCSIVNRKVGKAMCKYCRYQKCLSVGIGAASKSSENSDSKESEIFLAELRENLPSLKYAYLEDFEILYDKVVQILEHQSKSSLSLSVSNSNYFEDFNKLLRNFLKKTKPKQTLVLIKNDDLRLEFLSKFYVKTAKLLSRFMPFAALPLIEKKALFRAFWQSFLVLERFFQGSNIFGNDPMDFRIPVDRFQFNDLSTVERHYGHCANAKSYLIFLQPLFNRGRQIHVMFKETKITDFEFCYISLLQLWSLIELPDLSDSTHELGNKIIAQASDALHNIYLEEVGMPSYAARQAQLFRLFQMIEIFNREKEKMIAAKGIFDSSNDSFPYCKFELNYYNFINKYRE